MRRGVNALRRETNKLQKEINFLQIEVKELQAEIDTVQESNAKLQKITHVQDRNIQDLVHLVQENQEILDEMRVSVFLSAACCCYLLS